MTGPDRLVAGTAAPRPPAELAAPARAPRPHADLTDYRHAVDDALRAGRDVWGEQVLRNPDGPTFDGVADFLTPLLLGDRTYLTDTGVHYVVFTEPLDSDTFALHVADGSQVIVEYTNRWGAPDWAVPFPPPPRGGESVLVYDLLVGADAGELFGTHDPDLVDPGLAQGWLPILVNDYRDGSGTRWHRESFATRGGTGELVSYVRLALAGEPAPDQRVAVRVRAGGADPVETAFAVPADTRCVHLRLANGPSPEPVVEVDAGTYAAARAACVAYWRGVASEGARLTVPDQRVMDALANIVTQNLVLGERYSIGNPYETTFLMEAHGAVLALLRWGFTTRATECLDRLVGMTNGPAPEWYESWERGVKLAAAAEHARLSGTSDLLDRHLPTYLGYVDDFAAQRRDDPHGLLAPERYAWDIPQVVYGWHSQAAAWQGARDLLAVLAERGAEAATAERVEGVSAFRTALERAMRASTTVLDDGSVFIPVSLLSEETPHEELTGTRLANYWNLVAPYALATGIVTPGSPLARGLLHYMATHGAWLLGLTRFNGLYDPPTPIGTWREDGTAGYCTPGVDNAFGVQTLFFLADNEQADRLGLAMYAKLAHGMTRGTFVDGEATTIGVRAEEYHRSTWYPPNGTSNAMFLESLRLLLLHERRGEDGLPEALELAWATPRWWLRDGDTIALEGMPTSFGPVSFRVESRVEAGHVDVWAAVPPTVPATRVHVRLPNGWIVDPALDLPGWDAATGTLSWDAPAPVESVRLPVVRSDSEP